MIVTLVSAIDNGLDFLVVVLMLFFMVGTRWDSVRVDLGVLLLVVVLPDLGKSFNSRRYVVSGSLQMI